MDINSDWFSIWAAMPLLSEIPGKEIMTISEAGLGDLFTKQHQATMGFEENHFNPSAMNTWNTARNMARMEN